MTDPRQATSIFQRKVPNSVAFALIGLVFFGALAALWALERAKIGRLAPGSGNPKAWIYENRAGIPDSARASWGFNFSPALIPVREIVTTHVRRDGIPALVEPDFIPAAECTALNPNESVIGVRLGGEARAYPLKILARHECVNDVLGARPIAVTYSPMTNSVAVFSREIGGRTRELRNSGLFYQSNSLYYDRQADPHDESLWSQLLMQAVCGPAAAARLKLELIDSDWTIWGDWRARNPETTVLSASTGYSRDYARNLYIDYFEREELVLPLSVRSGRRRDLRNMDPLMIVFSGARSRAYPIRDIQRAPGCRLRDQLDQVRFDLDGDPSTTCVRLSLLSRDDAAATVPLSRAYAAWFAWDCLHPKGELHGAR